MPDTRFAHVGRTVGLRGIPRDTDLCPGLWDPVPIRNESGPGSLLVG
jgi:hypothetical protein